MIELNIYATGLRDSNKIAELGHRLEATSGGAIPPELGPKTKTQLLSV